MDAMISPTVHTTVHASNAATEKPSTRIANPIAQHAPATAIIAASSRARMRACW